MRAVLLIKIGAEGRDIGWKWAIFSDWVDPFRLGIVS